MEQGRALINMDAKKSERKVSWDEKWYQIKQLLSTRMMWGIYIGQYCVNALTYFFNYLVPGLSGAGARHVDSEGGFYRLDSGGVRLPGR